MLAFFGCISSHFRRIIFQIFPGEHAPGPPYLAHACAFALAPHLENPLRGPCYSPFLNIVEQAISSLKAAIKGDVWRPAIQARMDDRAETSRLGIPLGEIRTRLLLDALQR